MKGDSRLRLAVQILHSQLLHSKVSQRGRCQSFQNENTTVRQKTVQTHPHHHHPGCASRRTPKLGLSWAPRLCLWTHS